MFEEGEKMVGWLYELEGRQNYNEKLPYSWKFQHNVCWLSCTDCASYSIERK